MVGAWLENCDRICIDFKSIHASWIEKFLGIKCNLKNFKIALKSLLCSVQVNPNFGLKVILKFLLSMHACMHARHHAELYSPTNGWWCQGLGWLPHIQDWGRNIASWNPHTPLMERTSVMEVCWMDLRHGGLASQCMQDAEDAIKGAVFAPSPPCAQGLSEWKHWLQGDQHLYFTLLISWSTSDELSYFQCLCMHTILVLVSVCTCNHHGDNSACWSLTK